MPEHRLAVIPVLAVVAAKSAVNLAFADRYGWHRDELYLRTAGRHPALGYIDFPPVTPLLARFDSLVALRSLVVLAGALVIVVAALVARDLGGGRRAQVTAAVVVGFSPMLLAANGLFQPVSFDQLASLVVLWLAVRIALRPSPRLWPLLGLAVGIGLETKYTLGVLAGILLAAFALWRRDALRPGGLAIALAVAVALVAPNLVWQLRHDWASIRFFLDPPPSASDESRPLFLLNLVLLTGVLAFPLAVAGVVLLWRDRRLRPLGATVVGVACAYLVLGGKSYYALPALLFAVAAGSVWFERRRRHVVVPAAVFALGTLVFLPISVPVVPIATAQEHGVVDVRGGDYEDEVGWPELVAAVERNARGEPVVVAENYGEAGALVLLGHGLPPVASGHLSFRSWRPAANPARGLVVGFPVGRLAALCSRFEVVDRIAIPHGVDNEERGRPIARCTFRGGSLDAVWPDLLYPRT